MATSRLDALRALRQHEDVLTSPRRWVVYVASGDDLLGRFADTVVKAGGQWKPLAIDPCRLPDVAESLRPDAVVIAREELPPWSLEVDGRQRLVTDDSHFSATSEFLKTRSRGAARI